MADVVDPETRSRMMAGIRGRGTKPEMFVRRAIFKEGLRYRLHRGDLPGRPDIVLSGKRIAIFVHGCFWHRHTGCKYAKLPSSNTDFWREKLDGNVQRDQRAVDDLRSAGWRVLIVWECAIRDKTVAIYIGALVRQWVDGGNCVGEIAMDDPALH